MRESKDTLDTVLGIFDVKIVVGAVDQKAKDEEQCAKEPQKECEDAKIFDGRSFVCKPLQNYTLKVQQRN